MGEEVTTRAVRVLVIAGTRLYARALAEVLGRRPGLEVVGTAEHAGAGLARLALLSPDVVLLDLGVGEAIGC